MKSDPCTSKHRNNASANSIAVNQTRLLPYHLINVCVDSIADDQTRPVHNHLNIVFVNSIDRVY